MHDPDYTLKIKHTLTIKPLDFFMTARLRTEGVVLTPAPHVTEKDAPGASMRKENEHDIGSSRRLAIFFASNSGSCEAFAQQLATDATARGLPATVQTLDSAVGALGKFVESAEVVVICPSYEGEPADNGRQFVSWIVAQPEGSLAGLKYAVFGAGHEDWAETYQKIPKLIDGKMAELGGTRILERGVGNAAGDFFGAFNEWEGELLKKMGTGKLGGGAEDKLALDVEVEPEVEAEGEMPETGLRVEFIDERRAMRLGHKNFKMGVVTENRALTSEEMACGSLPKRHIEVRLPQGSTYRAGTCPSLGSLVVF
jgi:cytochrome P450 / NADPH-cytochrome P450 reductase